MGEKIAKNKLTEKNTNIPPFKSKKRQSKKWIAIGLILIILLGVGFVFRTSLIDLMKDVPLVNKLIPYKKESEEGLSKEELLDQYETQKQELLLLQEKINSLEELNKDLETRNTTLKEYESNYEIFLEQKSAWDQSIAESNPELFIEQFEKIYPETAEELYKNLKSQVIYTKEQQNLAKAVGDMDEDQAARALEVLLTTDDQLVRMIMQEMKDDKKSLILSSMTSDAAAKVIKLISPEINNQQD